MIDLKEDKLGVGKESHDNKHIEFTTASRNFLQIERSESKEQQQDREVG